MPRLQKPPRNRLHHGEIYQTESLHIDSAHAATNQCLECHSPHTIHQPESRTEYLGVGLDLNVARGSATIDSRGRLQMSAEVGNGVIAGVTVAHNSNTGPRVIVNSGSRSVQTSGNATSTYSAQADNTRSGG